MCDECEVLRKEVLSLVRRLMVLVVALLQRGMHD